MKCPICTSIDLVMTERQGVEIDYCPTCRGVWLDRGELDKIIERSYSQAAASAPPAAPTPQHDPRMPEHDSGHHHDNEYHGSGRKKHRSWMGELFD